jgi:putative spermidine/putrescine transport system permease protein
VSTTELGGPSPARRLFGWLYRRPRLQLTGLLVAPVGWFGVVYFGSLALLFAFAFWSLDPQTGEVMRQLTLANFQRMIDQPVYATIVLRTVTVAAVVTVVDAIIAFPIAYYMARIASPRKRAILFMSVLLPLWASYLVKAYAWRVILAPNGLIDWSLQQVGFTGASDLFGISDLSMTITFIYVWLPYMILPIFAGLERIPSSYLEASADLGARGGMTFRRVVLPLVMPALVAGSIFTFSLTLGDYIIPALVSNSQFIGNVVFQSQGVAGDVPFAAAFALVPVAIMGVYLLAARRLGAFDAL